MNPGNLVCAACGRSYPRGATFRHISDGRGGVRLVCRMCTPRIGELPPAPGEPAEKKPSERRRHKRIERHLLLFFRHVRDRIERRGLVRNISPGGTRFVTSELLSPGELINLRVVSPLTGIEIKAVGRVKWVRQADQRQEAGIEFVARSRHFDMQDRRQHHRVSVAFELVCELGGRLVHGRVKDISQGGIRFLSPEPVTVGSRLLVRLEAVGVEAVAGEQRFPMQVERTVLVVGLRDSTEKWEVRARFLPAPGNL